MPKKGMRDLVKEQRWRQLLADYRASSLNGAEYCRQNGITYSLFKDWQKKLKTRDAEDLVRRQRKPPRRNPRYDTPKNTESDEPAFVPVNVAAQPRIAKPQIVGIELMLKTGHSLRITDGCSLEFLASVVDVLEGR
jgi:transposase